ncbi:hypothetical protein AB6889_04150 [Carnobacterium maltaromaticum]|uniref:hypothetical protein n=1 Tax=Carnobacterium maltaromaticum TaxID=2751 RepID=UPI0039BE91F4
MAKLKGSDWAKAIKKQIVKWDFSTSEQIMIDIELLEHDLPNIKDVRLKEIIKQTIDLAYSIHKEKNTLLLTYAG